MTVAENLCKYLLSVDNGGTYIKAALIDIAGKQIGIAKRYNKVIHRKSGYSEYDLNELWQTNCVCIREVLAETGISPEQIACVGFAGQGKGIYPVDESGKPFMPAISSSDLRAYKYSDAWRVDGTSERLYGQLYQNAGFNQPVTLLAWLKDNQPEDYARIRWVFSMKDYLLYKLTGAITAGKGTQSGTCLVDLNTCEYDEALLDAYGIPEMKGKLAPLIWDTELGGKVTEEAAAQTGLAMGTPVAAGMFDLNASAIAMGAINDTTVFTIAGTVGISGYISTKPVTQHSTTLNSLYSLEGTYLIEEGSPASAGSLEWVIDALFDRSKENEKQFYVRINDMVEAVAPDDSNLIFLPYLNGSSESSMSRGAWIGLRSDHTKAAMLRAVYEGVAFTHAIRIEKLLSNREKPEKVMMAGGATNSDVWVQMFADVLGLPVEVCANEEMGAKGLAICSAVAVGLYPDIQAAVKAMKRSGRIVYPRAEYEEVYRKKFERYKRVSDKMLAIWPDFAE